MTLFNFGIFSNKLGNNLKSGYFSIAVCRGRKHVFHIQSWLDFEIMRFYKCGLCWKANDETLTKSVPRYKRCDGSAGAGQKSSTGKKTTFTDYFWIL